MEDIQKYLLSVILSALICGMLPSLLQNGSMKELTKTICGIILTLTVIAPFRDIELTIPEDFSFFGEDTAAFAVAEGEDLAQQAIAEIIKEETEAYILDKAAELNEDIDVDILVSEEDPPLPVSAVIRGDVSPQSRSQLQSILSEQLNIAKEDQTWIG